MHLSNIIQIKHAYALFLLLMQDAMKSQRLFYYNRKSQSLKTMDWIQIPE